MKIHNQVRAGSKVAFNVLADAVWFDVIEIRGFAMRVRETGTENAEQAADLSLVKQVRNE